MQFIDNSVQWLITFWATLGVNLSVLIRPCVQKA